MRKPCTLAELQCFYISEYRPLYDRFVTENGLPQELHAEVAAAFDHLMRHTSKNGEINAKDFDRVVGHLKRAFEEWKLLLPIADEFIEIETSPKIQRAQKIGRVQRFWSITEKVFWTVGGAFLGVFLRKLFG